VKNAFWKQDWVVGLAVSVLLLFLSNFEVFQSMERAAYDLGVGWNSHRPASDKLAIIAIDERSIANLGRWPWPRDVQAQALLALSKAGAKVVGNTIFYTEPQTDRGLAVIREITKLYDNSSLTGLRGTLTTLADLVNQAQDGWAGHPPPKARTPDEREHLTLGQLLTFLGSATALNRAPEDAARLREALGSAERSLNMDDDLARAIRSAGNIVLGMAVELGIPEGRLEQATPEYLRRNALTNVVDQVDALDNEWFPNSAQRLMPPLAEFGGGARAIGHLALTPDPDGAVRNIPLVLNYFGEYYPAMALLIAAHYLNLPVADLTLRLAEGVQLGNRLIPTNQNLLMYPHFYPTQHNGYAFSVDSFFDAFDVATGKLKLSPAKYAGKIVLIGATAQGLGDSYPTPVASSTWPVEILAHEVSAILQGHFYQSPGWAPTVEWLTFLLVALYLILILPRLKAGLATIVTSGLLITLLGANFFFLTQASLWLRLIFPAILLITGHLFFTTKRYFISEKGKEAADSAAAESNRMLGLAFQSQGQLDMAFEKFRKSPMDNALLELLYNLALDFERKRQYAKANSVFGYMADFNAKFRDIQERIKRNRNLEETVVLGGARSTGPGGTLVLNNSPGAEKPMLGRYQVEKELGRGAMGAVYLGRDPKINRVVAIKTIPLSQEFAEDELVEVKQRFFREAETAGRLSHPNIVTIYDAGEEQDLAYIAMELLKGKDLAGYTHRDNLLPIATVLDLVRRVAEALAYAHSQNVVHRDIKPANIMYEPDTGIIKVTDFGIARITDSSKTKTGMVMGTPSYMSPEQLAGQKVDGRSDLFSLGVMFYQLLSGELPFTGESIATLMYRIANVPHRDVRELRPELPPCLTKIINKALEKDITQRYQNGSDLARELAVCTTIQGGV